MKRRMAWEDHSGRPKSIPGERANLQDPENEGGVIWKQEARYILAEIMGFKPQLSVAKGVTFSKLLSLSCFSFSICNMETIIVLPYKIVGRIKWENIKSAQSSAHSKSSIFFKNRGSAYLESRERREGGSRRWGQWRIETTVICWVLFKVQWETVERF